ncbi:MAG: hypothetical protein A2Z68_00835 [Candidatus Nealsonbacteria bacterium RBG_13_38_11]|uniref:Uncharacterized protein n=1 Tax=Candidatus Nealsonbacteria bacterium RBG_13_38_11 TaxID=1801662 RepID=A0A1G2DZP6_9BACT|nr:MAG: hypothetical protein A2Z68_00835 [Candidatus Nealsonbacteria bacterium RBG_13_38_11]
MFIENGIANIQEIVTEKLTAKKARLDKIEMVDQNTGEIYCTWVQDGEWIKEKGECDNPESTSEPSAPNTVPDETIDDNIPPEETLPEEIVPEETPEETSDNEEIISEETPSEESGSLAEEILPDSQ